MPCAALPFYVISFRNFDFDMAKSRNDKQHAALMLRHTVMDGSPRVMSGEIPVTTRRFVSVKVIPEERIVIRVYQRQAVVERLVISMTDWLDLIDNRRGRRSKLAASDFDGTIRFDVDGNSMVRIQSRTNGAGSPGGDGQPVAADDTGVALTIDETNRVTQMIKNYRF